MKNAAGLLFLTIFIGSYSRATLPKPDPEAPNFCELRSSAAPRPIDDPAWAMITETKQQQDHIWERFRALHQGEQAFSQLEPSFRDEVLQLVLKILGLEGDYGFDEIVETGLSWASLAQILNYGGGIPTKADLLQLEKEFFAESDAALDPSVSAISVVERFHAGLGIKGSMLQQLPALYNAVYPHDLFVPDIETQQDKMIRLFEKAALRAFTEENLPRLLAKAWSRESSTSPDAWTVESPALDQSVATALLVQDILGGSVLWAKATLPSGQIVSHYKNLIGGKELDFTAQQFPQGTEIPNGSAKEGAPLGLREHLLSFEAFRTHYEKLRSDLMKSLKE